MRLDEAGVRGPGTPPALQVKPFRIDVPEATLERIRERLAAFDPDALSRQPGWGAGTDPAALAELVRYWLTDYDWRRHEQELNTFEQFVTTLDGVELHALREPGSGTAPRTVLLLHGWPTSFATFRKVVRRLAHPETVGGDPDDGLTVVVPSLPGYGFSTLSPSPLGFRGTSGQRPDRRRRSRTRGGHLRRAGARPERRPARRVPRAAGDGAADHSSGPGGQPDRLRRVAVREVPAVERSPGRRRRVRDLQG
jgi:hypothetical protein